MSRASLVLLLAVPLTFSDLAQRIQACSIVKAETSRLACFDAIAVMVARASPAAPAPAPTVRLAAARAPAVFGQCAATTKKGTRCSRKAKAGSAYCWQHG